MENKQIPYLKRQQNGCVLMVNEKPFLMLSGEVHNSSSSSLSYMEPIWKKAEDLGLNSLLLPVSWEQVEPEEGVFDFTLVDGLIQQARDNGKKIGFLWFGSWKNAQCYYAPEWVKADTARFWRAEVQKGVTRTVLKYGMSYTTLSAFCEETLLADARAFSRLMAHLRQVDSEENTVVVVQVENETGLQGGARERSDLADSRFAEAVPAGLVCYLQEHRETLSAELKAAFSPQSGTNASWGDVFGEMAEEVFTAYYTASYVGFVAAEGKKEYPLPMTANCWLDKGQVPGKYPTGGPVAKVMDIWRFAAPAIEVIAPDIYVTYFCDICDTYTQKGNPLFIAECPTHGYASTRAIDTIGHYHALCYAPFGIEDMGLPFTAMQNILFGMDTEDPALKNPQDPNEYAAINRMLQGLMEKIGDAYGSRRLQGASSERGEGQILQFEKFAFQVSYTSPFLRRKNGACLILQDTPNTFYLLANGGMVTPMSANPDRPHVDYLSVEEGTFSDGAWVPGRRLNGDEVTLFLFETPTLLRIKLLSYR